MDHLNVFHVIVGHKAKERDFLPSWVAHVSYDGICRCLVWESGSSPCRSGANPEKVSFRKRRHLGSFSSLRSSSFQ